MNYWKARFLLLPFTQRKSSVGTGEKKKTKAQQEENFMEGFLKFLEILNRVKRFPAQKVPQTPKVIIVNVRSVHSSLAVDNLFLPHRHSP